MSNTTNPLLSKDADALAAKIVREAQEKDALTRQACATPFPGAAGDVFGVPPDVVVGRWKVRPFYDVDVEILKSIEHPLYAAMVAGMQGKDPEVSFVPRGPDAWLLCWMLTRTPDDAELLLAGKDPVFPEARREFGRLQLAAIGQLVDACLRQMALYSGTVLDYGPPRKDDADGKNPPSAQ